ncbi:MAG: FAD-dependent oxidoreductase [Pirellulales bacterium]
MKRLLLVLALTCFSFARSASAATVLVEAESMADKGGWVLDQQSMDQMGSPYLLAHGLGVPVADAVATVPFPAPGPYRVFVRTKDWVARWKAPGSPGKFQVLVQGKPLETVFGTQGADWFWQDGGSVTIPGKETSVALHDLTGFEGRCDAIVFSDEPGFAPPNEPAAMAAFRRKALGLPDRPAEAGTFDLVVVGGGVAGTCAAVSAARLGLGVALIQDRPVLGGNSSSEIRVWIQGRVNQPPYPRIGDVVKELNAKPPTASPDTAEAHGDQRKLDVVQKEKNVSLFLNHHVVRVEKQGDRIAAVVARSTLDGRESRFAGKLFADCTGDGTVGFLAGADWEMLPQGHLGSSNLWRSVDTGEPSPFPRCPWALDLTGKPFPRDLKQLGVWFWEGGFSQDTIRDVEAIRDNNLRAIYGAWDAMKNVENRYPNRKLEWIAHISGKRESRRLLGDVVLTKQDVVKGVKFPDACVATTWTIDLHYADEKYSKDFPGQEFIARAEMARFRSPYPIPYRCLYSRNVGNLFMAGRDISVTHEALGTVRVMGTGGMMGEVVGKAASICKRHDATPREVYQKHLDEFKKVLGEK